MRDRLGGGVAEVRARVILNATGPWSDIVRRLADPGTRPRLRTTKGAHIMVPAERLGNRGAITFRSPVDGRVMFVLPWGDFSYVGTTDTDFRGSPADVRADEADVRYLLESANSIFPAARLAAEDVVSTWAGLRPLLAPLDTEGGRSESATSREHEIWQDRNGLLNVAGGKLTTYRVMADEVADEAARILRERYGVASGSSLTEDLPSRPPRTSRGTTSPRASSRRRRTRGWTRRRPSTSPASTATRRARCWTRSGATPSWARGWSPPSPTCAPRSRAGCAAKWR